MSTGPCPRIRFQLLPVLCMLSICALAVWMLTVPAHAQSCSTDAQCGPSAGGYNSCLGNTLIRKRRLCVAGRCVEQEMSRISCGTGFGGGFCQGSTYVRSGGGCDALSGSCRPASQIRISCVKTCSCKANRLVISTGQCGPGGCVRGAFRCKKGCTCSPEPRCLEDTVPAMEKKPPARKLRKRRPRRQ